MKEQNKIFALEGKVQHYQWGGFTFLPALLSRSAEAGQPFAEYWLGAHIQAPAAIKGNGDLDEFINADRSVLGQSVKHRFGRLPYLLKVLDVKDMLSIQVHPTRASAKAGFEAENAAGVPLTAGHRNYKDDNHKPELATALGPFWLLHGFRAPDSMRRILNDVPELRFLLAYFNGGDYKTLYRYVMEMEPEQVNSRLQPLLERILPLYESGKLEKSNPDFWAARAAITFNQPGQIDRGIFSVYLLNLVFMNAGDAIFQDAGILHAYLEGQNVEIMANSDNVLRGGLTPKHIDVPELMKHVRFEPVTPAILKGEMISAHEKAFVTPADDFELHEIRLAEKDTYTFKVHTVDILLVMEGAVKASEAGGHSLHVDKGDSLMLTDGAIIMLESTTGALVYRATVPSAR